MKFKRYKKTLDYSYAIGTTITIELLRQRPESVIKVFHKSNLKRDETYLKLSDLCSKAAVDLEENDKIFNVMAQKDNSYVMGVFEKFENSVKEADIDLLLVNPSNAGNLGTIMRTMSAFEIRDLHIIEPAVDIYDPKVIRATMGTFFHLRFQRYQSLEEFMRGRRTDCNYYPFMLDAERFLNEAGIKKPACLILGNEASGLPDYYHDLGTPLKIPVAREVDSLSLPIAAALGLYEARFKND